MRVYMTLLASFSLFLLTNGLLAQETPVKVSTVAAEKKVMKRTVTGFLKNKSISRVASEEQGLVIAADFRQGDILKKGTVLYKLNDQDLQLELEQAKAELVKANSFYAQKAIEMKFSEQELIRRKKAIEKTPGVISEYDLAKYEHDFAMAKEVLNTSKNEKDLCEIRIKIINKKIQDMTIKTPFDGLVAFKGKELGEWVNKGESVAVVSGLDVYEAHFEIPQSIPLQSLIHIQEIEVKIEGAEKKHIAKKFNFSVSVNERSRNYTVAGLIEGESLDLISGRTISALIPIGEEKTLLRISSNAIIKDPAGYFVYKITQIDEKTTIAMQVPVQIEFAEGSFHFCTSAILKSGDKIVTEGNERLRPMAPLVIIGENE